jgi:hypothetical protein
MGTITVINATPYNLQPVPEVGKEYHIFDDGKISINRHYTAKVLEVIPFAGCEDLELITAWSENIGEVPWLYAENTDYFVKAVSSFDVDNLYFVRTVDGGWFSIDYPHAWMGARLDIDGSLLKEFKSRYD